MKGTHFNVQPLGLVLFLSWQLLCPATPTLAQPSTTPRNPSTLSLSSATFAHLSPLVVMLRDLSIGPLALTSTLASLLPVPLAASGNCTAGSVYTMSTYKQVYSLIPQLECVFAAGVAIPQVPLGGMYGRILLVGNTAFWDAPIETVFQGDWVVKTRCHTDDPVYRDNKITSRRLDASAGPNSRETTRRSGIRSRDIDSGSSSSGDSRNSSSFDLFLNVLRLAGIGVRSGAWYVPPVFPYPHVATGEYLNAIEPTLVNEPGFDVAANCPPYVPKQLIPSNYELPVRLFVDQYRAIGRDEGDGCLLFLGRAFLKSSDQHVDPQFITHPSPAFPPSAPPTETSSVILSTFLYWMMKTCDPTVLPNSFKSGPTSSLPPLKDSFNYTRRGLKELISQIVKTVVNK
eukprot:GHVS01028957.1.p1 GENE.GHVS01028957.1~~GHVS01028957.1.p1  ORF type:complete len:401 (+),score=42.43 GHVS01028957.1:40-1242(+)